MAKYLVFGLIVLGLAATALILIATSRIDDFRTYHQSLARESATSAAQAIAHDIAEKERLVEIFGYDHLKLITALAENPDDIELHARLSRRLAIFFPDYFTFTIANASGKPYMEDFDGLIGEMCANDLSEFAHGENQQQRIHPHPDVYHFDILTRFGADADAVILFVSFQADALGNTLRSVQATGHRLMLIQPSAGNLIEVTAAGSRINLERDDYRLTDKEMQRELFSKPVPGTHWVATDFHAGQLFTNYAHKIVVQSIIIFALFLGVTLTMLRLIHKEERLRKAAEANKDEFLSVVSHELRTPITSISGSLSLVISGATGEVADKTRDLLSLAQNNCSRMNILINDLLDLQKIEAGRMDYDIRPVELDALLQQCIEHNQGYAEKFGVRLDNLTPRTGLRINADAHRIMQVMSNLLSNAAKYGARNDSIAVAAERRDRFVRISVTDHGPGIPESFRKRVFQRFARADKSDSTGISGTGLGLSIVKSIVEQHGGHAGYFSETGKGSTFYIDLPLGPAKTT